MFWGLYLYWVRRWFCGCVGRSRNVGSRGGGAIYVMCMSVLIFRDDMVGGCMPRVQLHGVFIETATSSLVTCLGSGLGAVCKGLSGFGSRNLALSPGANWFKGFLQTSLESYGFRSHQMPHG